MIPYGVLNRGLRIRGESRIELWKNCYECSLRRRWLKVDVEEIGVQQVVSLEVILEERLSVSVLVVVYEW